MNDHRGSTFDDFLESEGILDDVIREAKKKIEEQRQELRRLARRRDDLAWAVADAKRKLEA